MNDVFKKLSVKLKNPRFLIIIGISGMVLILISSFLGDNSKKTESNTEEKTNITAEEYRKELEKSVSMLVESITGDSSPQVVITLESGIKYSYADVKETTVEDESSSGRVSTGSEQKHSYVTVKTADGGEEALLVTTQMPEVRGVAIVCEGGDNEIINEKIQNAVTAALNITSKRVYIAGGNSYEKR